MGAGVTVAISMAMAMAVAVGVTISMAVGFSIHARGHRFTRCRRRRRQRRFAESAEQTLQRRTAHQRRAEGDTHEDIPLEQPHWLLPQPMHPLQSADLHPSRRAPHLAAQEAEADADAE